MVVSSCGAHKPEILSVDVWVDVWTMLLSPAGPSVEVKEEPQPGPSGEQEIQVKEEEQEDETMEAEPDE